MRVNTETNPLPGHNAMCTVIELTLRFLILAPVHVSCEPWPTRVSHKLFPHFCRPPDGVETSLDTKSCDNNAQTPDVNILDPSYMRYPPESKSTCDPTEILLRERGSKSATFCQSPAFDTHYVSERITVGDNFMVLHCDARYWCESHNTDMLKILTVVGRAIGKLTNLSVPAVRCFWNRSFYYSTCTPKQKH